MGGFYSKNPYQIIRRNKSGNESGVGIYLYYKKHGDHILQINFRQTFRCISIHWTGLLDWNTGLDYLTELFSFFEQVSVFIFKNKPSYTFLQSTTWLLWMIVIITNSCLLYSVFTST